MNSFLENEFLKIYSEAWSRFVDQLYHTQVPLSTYEALRDSLSRAQQLSKLRLVQEFANRSFPSKKTFFIGHWHGLLPFFLLQAGFVEEGIGIEYSSEWRDFSRKINAGLNWQTDHGDASQLSEEFYRNHSFDCIVNTSCEHMDLGWLKAVPARTWIVVQSSDLDIPEHTHRPASLQDFQEQLQLSTVKTSFQQDFGHFSRFTVIGQR